MKNKTEALQPDTFYHIYNRGNGNEDIFLDGAHYQFFLKKYKDYISPICNTYCYCLMPNHFHLLIEMKSEGELNTFFRMPEKDLSALISKQFSNFFNSYAKAFNLQQERKGNLFMRPFKRKKITGKEYLLKLVHYIHYNPVEAGLCKNANDWNFSSYSSIISSSPPLLKRTSVIEWFNDNENFIHIHRQLPKELNTMFD